jgi:hypothetical protein
MDKYRSTSSGHERGKRVGKKIKHWMSGLKKKLKIVEH